MENKDFQNKFRQELTDHKVYIDKDALWAGIQSEKRKKRFRFIFWFGAGSLAIILGIGVWSTFGSLSSDDNINTVPTNLKVEESKIAKSTVEVIDEPKEEVIEKDILPVRNISNEEKTLVKNENSEIYNQVYSDPQLIMENQVKEKRQEYSSPKMESISENINLNTTQSENENIIKQNIVLIDKDYSIVQVETSAALDQLKKTITKPELHDNNVTPNAIKDKAKINSDPLTEDLKEADNTKSNVGPEELDKDDQNNKVTASSDPTFRFEVVPQIEYGIPIKTLLAKSAIDHDLDELRNQIETPLENWSVGLSFQANHKSGLYLAAGFRFDQLQEIVDYTETLQDPILLNDVILKQVTLADGSITNITGNANGTSLSTNVYHVYNTYRRFSVPLSLGYEKNWKNWAIDAGANFIFNVKHTFNGYILEYDGTDENYQLAKDADIFRSRLDMDTRLNLGVTYKFSKWKIRLSPFVQLNESHILQADAELSQGYRFYGLSLGLRL